MATTKVKYPEMGVGRPRSVFLNGTITIGASGAVSSSSSETATVVKTGSEVGRYTLTFDRKYKNVRPLSCGIIGPTDAAMGNTAANVACFRNSSGTGMDIQLFLASSGADTETTSGNIVVWSAEVQF